MTTHQRNFPSIDPEKLGRLAETAIKVGLRLQPGQDLFLTAPVDALPLARAIVTEAYKAGAARRRRSSPTRRLRSPASASRPDASFDRAPGWLYDGVAKAFGANTARLAIVGEDPMLLANEDPAKVARASKANSIAYQPALEKIAGFDINWNLVAYPTDSWRKRVFPGETDDVAVGRLAEAIFSASRVDNDDPVAAWTSHNAALAPPDRMAERLRTFNALHYSGPGMGSDGIGLAEGHAWEGGAATAKNGIILQSEHPDRRGVHDPARAPGRRPCRLAPSRSPIRALLIDGIAVRFEAGGIVEAKAARARTCSRKCSTATTARGASARSRWCRILRRSRRAASCSSIPCSTTCPPHRARTNATRSVLSTATSSPPTEIAAQRRQQEHDPYRLDHCLDRIDIDGVYADGRRMLASGAGASGQSRSAPSRPRPSSGRLTPATFSRKREKGSDYPPAMRERAGDPSWMSSWLPWATIPRG